MLLKILALPASNRMLLQFVLPLLFVAVHLGAQPAVPQGGTREVVTLQRGWKFHLGAMETGANTGCDDSRWEEVSLPHDWAIGLPCDTTGDGNTGKQPWKGEAWYRLHFRVPGNWEGKHLYMVCDGIMAFPEIYLNGQLAGTWDYGYNSFFLDLSGKLRPGTDQVIAIHTDTRQHDSRWYPGAGIYRKIQLVAVQPVHVDIWGTHVRTPVLKPHYGEALITTDIKHPEGAGLQLTLETRILNPEGREVARTRQPVTTTTGKHVPVETRIALQRPRHWDVDHPNLYQAVSLVYRDGQLQDSVSTAFGFRSIRLTADDGLVLNGRRVQIKGVNLHHDHGPLGAAFYPRAMERQLELLKGMGCNAIRTSHNAPAPELLDLCDRMGFLVLDELFDKYDRKADIMDTTDFEAFARRNVRNFLLRDRNHPCVFLWSVGNEMGDVQNDIRQGFARLHTMVSLVRQYDPDRPVTMVCDDQQSAALRHFDYYDVHCWNYGRRYSLARQLEPRKPVIISESASTLSTRGFYEWPLPRDKTAFTRSLQVSSYDLHAPEWAELADDDFMWQQDEPYIAGEFAWTGFDYLGESTPYHNEGVRAMGMTDRQASRSSYFGIFDLCGIPKDRYFLYKSYWKPEENTIHILPHWNWGSAAPKNIPVFVYTNADEAELFLNGRSLGRRTKMPRSGKSTERFRLRWDDVPFQPGQLKAVAYREGNPVGESIVRTTGAPYALRLTPDRSRMNKGGMDLSYVLVEAVDREGNPCPLADYAVEISVKGPGRVAGIANGNPQSSEAFQANTIRLFYGKAMLIIGAGYDKGSVEINASAKGLQGTASRLVVE